ITTNSSLVTQQATAATAGANQSSPSIYLKANYWDSAATQIDTFSITDIMGAGANPTATLTFDHPSGTTGAKQYAFMNGNVGIGTTAPQRLLQVHNVGGATSSVFLSRGTNATDADFLSYVPAGAASGANPSWQTGLNTNSANFGIFTN